MFTESLLSNGSIRYSIINITTAAIGKNVLNTHFSNLSDIISNILTPQLRASAILLLPIIGNYKVDFRDSCGPQLHNVNIKLGLKLVQELKERPDQQFIDLKSQIFN
jgi:hypothetical protein